jgi:predicted dehydrogenase
MIGEHVWTVARNGEGNYAKAHAGGLLRHPDRVRLVAVADPDNESRSTYAESYAAQHAYG